MKLHPRLTPRGVLLARAAERFRPVAECDDDGWVVGYGHRASAREGAGVSEDDALVLLTYDLSQSAGRIAPLLVRPVSPELFDALNACAFRMGPDAFARSEVLRRVNAGEGVAPDEPIAEAARRDAPPTAVAAAADAVRDRLAQVLAEPEPPPPRSRREPWREPAQTPERQAVLPDPFAGPAAKEADVAAGPSLSRPSGVRRPDLFSTSPLESAASSQPPATAPAPEPVVEPLGLVDRHERDIEEPAPPPLLGFAPEAEVEARPAVAVVSTAPSVAPAPGRGGRPRLWERLRGDPRVYMALGACGLALFVCALLGFLLGRPTAPGLALGVAGVVCLAPALAFFLHRRGGPDAATG